uniref:Metallophosphoesterase domain containing 2a n=1 Tax=Astatotilapia calliptera TaxID=8154 RepID=A0AAX7USY0_ASTCA
MAHGKVTITVDEYSSNPTQAFTHYNINQSRFQPPHVHMVDPIPYDTPKPAGHTRFVCVSDTHSRTDGIQMPYGDVLLHMGDFTELGLPSEVKKFNDWLGTELLNPHFISKKKTTHFVFNQRISLISVV